MTVRNTPKNRPPWKTQGPFFACAPAIKMKNMNKKQIHDIVASLVLAPQIRVLRDEIATANGRSGGNQDDAALASRAEKAARRAMEEALDPEYGRPSFIVEQCRQRLCDFFAAAVPAKDKMAIFNEAIYTEHYTDDEYRTVGFHLVRRRTLSTGKSIIVVECSYGNGKRFAERLDAFTFDELSLMAFAFEQGGVHIGDTPPDDIKGLTIDCGDSVIWLDPGIDGFPTEEDVARRNTRWTVDEVVSDEIIRISTVGSEAEVPPHELVVMGKRLSRRK